MQRRGLLIGSIAAALASPADAANPEPTPFDAGAIRNLARERAAAPYQPPDTKLPDAFANLGYDAYRGIRYDPAQALWHGQGLPFEAQFFHRGFIYPDRVEIFEVADGVAKPILYRPELYTWGPGLPPPPQGELGFAGFRLHAPLNRPDFYDEVCAFLGATYFRAVARKQGYGISARGLSLKTGNPSGEEFPTFRAFWLERPQPGTHSIVVHALLDSESCTGAMRFTIRPGDDTVVDVESTLFPRVDIAEAGIGTGTSMFWFDPSDRIGIDDYRRAVHDSDGLMMLTGRGEELWRPVANPRRLQVSSFVDTSPRGFGLSQRKRQFADFEDLEAHYERRPSLWVEPIGDWGEGQVQLIEIPSKDEFHDNIVAFWRPKQPLRAKSEVNFTCRLHWCDLPPLRKDLARFVATRSGAGRQPGSRLFVLDAVGEPLKALAGDAQPRVSVTADKGKIQNALAHHAPDLGGWRLSFELQTEKADAVELRAQLLAGDTPLTETWLYRWTP